MQHPTPPLPTGHFLSLPPSYTSSTSSHASIHAPNTATLASADFDVDVRTGFLPGASNVERLTGEWELWEEALDAARGTAEGTGVMLGGRRDVDKLWRDGVATMPVLSSTPLESSITLLRRAHLVLAFLAHFYIHTSQPGAGPIPIPESISIPLLAICPLLGLPPVLTYADTVLYNFAPKSLAALSLANPPSRALVTFTNTRSEEQFYVISAMCEINGAEALRIMRQSLDELFLADTLALKRLTIYLKKLANQIDVIGDTTLSMMKHIDPEEFYHLIRPWYKGGDSHPAGWAYLGAPADIDAAENIADMNGAPGRMFSGPSAGQSSLIHAIDIFLTVDHTSSETTNEATFVQRMLQYMPAPHRTFLSHLADHPTPLRPLVVHHSETHPHLAQAYDLALEALKRFREKHMRIVSMFIVQQARRTPSERIQRLTGMDNIVELGDLRGTGGSPLFIFLKRCRDNTTRAMLRPSGAGYNLE